MNAGGIRKAMEMAKAYITPSEETGRLLANKVLAYIKKHDGRCLRDDNGHLNLVIGGRRIVLDFRRDNLALAGLLIKACDVSTCGPAAQVAIQRVQVGMEAETSELQYRRFSALSSDQERLYIPIEGGQLLRICAGDYEVVANGTNEDHLWVEHPEGEPFRFVETAHPEDALERFERLLVSTQACANPAMRWLVGMNLGLFPFVRECSPARFLMTFIGPSQTGGKTSGAERFTRLHGLGSVKGDYTVAALANTGDIGLLVMDNKEQANLDQALIDFLLSLATGGDRGRCYADGQMRKRERARPIGVITTIEGVVRGELQNRCVEIPYAVKGGLISRGPIELEIAQCRNEILSVVPIVFARYFQLRADLPSYPIPRANLGEHFAALHTLLHAYADVSGKGDHWASDQIQTWNVALGSAEAPEDDLEHPISRLLNDHDRNSAASRFSAKQITYEAVAGTLYVTETEDLLTMLQQLNIRDMPLPKNPQGLSRRLSSSKFLAFKYLKTGTEAIPELRRTTRGRPVGLFRPNDDGPEQ
jgi:hypothetical protein